MHEMSIAQNLLEIAEAEANKHGCKRLKSLTVHYGQISGVMPEALKLAFEALISDSLHSGAELHLVQLPLRLHCPFCHTSFGNCDSAFVPCPNCGEEFGHSVIQGKELLLARIEAVPN